MSALILPKRAQSFGDANVEANVSSSILPWEYMVDLWVPGRLGGIGALTGTAYTEESGFLQAPGPFGVGADDSSAVGIIVAADADDVLGTSECTIILVKSLYGSLTNGSTGIGYSGGASDRVNAHLPFGNGTVYWDYGNATEGSGRLSVSGQTWPLHQLDAFALVAGASRGREIWRNGVLIASNTSATASRASTTAALKCGPYAGFANQYTYLAGILNYAVDRAALAEITANPWQLLKASPRRIYFDLGAGGGISQALGQVTETDLSQAFGKAKVKATGQSSETDSAQTLTPVTAQIVAFAQAVESELAQGLTAAKVKAVGQAQETELAQGVAKSKVKATAQSTEADSAQSVSVAKTKAVSRVSESDLAQPLTQAGTTTFSQASEADSAQNFAKAKVKALGQVVDAQTALAFVAVRAKALVRASETETAQAIAKAKVKAFAQPTETDSAQPLSVAGPQIIALGQAVENDSASHFTREGYGDLPTGGGGGGGAGGAFRVGSARKLNELFDKLFEPAESVKAAVDAVETSFKGKASLEELVSALEVVEERETAARKAGKVAAAKKAFAIEGKLRKLKLELEAEEEAVVRLLLL